MIQLVDKDGNKKEFTVTGTEAEIMDTHKVVMNDTHKPKLGVMVENHEEGVLVNEVIEGSPANEMDLQAGDIIVAINDNPTKELNDLLEALDKTQNIAVVSYLRDGKRVANKVELKDFDYPKGESKTMIVKKIRSDKK